MKNQILVKLIYLLSQWSNNVVDLDGTLFKYGTNIPVDGALQYLADLKANEHQIVITTLRSNNNTLNEQITIDALKYHQIQYDHIVFGVSSPRILINDDGARAVEVIRDSGVNVEWGVK